MKDVMPKCKRCGAPALFGFVDGDTPITCGPCEQVLAEEREREKEVA